jgi:hypothetical protein
VRNLVAATAPSINSGQRTPSSAPTPEQVSRVKQAVSPHLATSATGGAGRLTDPAATLLAAQARCATLATEMRVVT